MHVTRGIASAIVGASLLGGVGVTVAMSSSSAPTAATLTLASTSATASPTASPTAGTTATPTAGPTAGPTATPAAGPAGAPDCTTRDDGSWPAFATGVPVGFDGGDSAGVYLWHDDGGWHLRVTHKNDAHQVYTGVLTTSGTFFAVEPVKLERSDTFRVGPRDHEIAFRLNNYGGVDGVDFRTHCASQITFQLKVDGHELETFQVHIGHDATNPTSVPFTVQRAR